MNGLDWLIVVTILLSLLLAAAHGFFFELFSLAGAVGGFILAAWTYPKLAPWFLPYVKQEWVASLAGFLTIYFAVVLIAGFAGRLARWVFKEAGMRWFDRLLGAAFGLVRGGAIATAVVVALASFSPGAPLLAQSRLGPYFLVLGHGASWLAPARLRSAFREGVLSLRGIPVPPAPGKDAPQH